MFVRSFCGSCDGFYIVNQNEGKEVLLENQLLCQNVISLFTLDRTIAQLLSGDAQHVGMGDILSTAEYVTALNTLIFPLFSLSFYETFPVGKYGCFLCAEYMPLAWPKITVSGISTGGAKALHFYLAHSNIVDGIAIFAGGT